MAQINRLGGKLADCPVIHDSCLGRQKMSKTKKFGTQPSTNRFALRAQRSNEDAVPLGDWRAFRAKLIQQEETPLRLVCEENVKVMREQNPRLAHEEMWAHPTPVPERGGLLVATPAAAMVLGDERYWQTVISIIQHDEDGTVGFILNRPTGLMMGNRLGGQDVQGAPVGLSEVFRTNRVYCGGFVAQQVVHLMHGYKALDGSLEVVPGIYMGGQAAAMKLILEGTAQPSEFRFFAGCVAWSPGQLEKEIKEGAWYTASCCRSLVLKQCLQLPIPLWREALELMGGDYLAVARKAYGME